MTDWRFTGWAVIEDDLAEDPDDRDGDFVAAVQAYADRRQAFEVYYVEREAA